MQYLTEFNNDLSVWQLHYAIQTFFYLTEDRHGTSGR